MKEQQHHLQLVGELAEQMKAVLERSEQGIYLYLDDSHKVCNKKFADLLGYESPESWAHVDAPLADVVVEDQQGVIDAYMKASEKMAASMVGVRIKNIMTGKIVKTQMIVAPIGHAGHVFTAHFITKV
jgi:hypothetical protein